MRISANATSASLRHFIMDLAFRGQPQQVEESSSRARLDMQILGTRRSKVSASRAKDQAALGTWQHQKAVLGARGGDHLYLPPGRLVRFLGCADYTTRLARALRAPQSVATPTRSGASNLDAIIDEGKSRQRHGAARSEQAAPFDISPRETRDLTGPLRETCQV